MDTSEQQFMRQSGLVQWLAAAVLQGQRLRGIYKDEFPKLHKMDNPLDCQMLMTRAHTEGNFLANAANQILRYLVWANKLHILSDVDFSALSQFDKGSIRDLRNMREHVIEYFKGEGNKQDRWFVETPEYGADASSVVGIIIGGRLDYEAFTSACEVTLQNVLTNLR